MRNMIGVLTLVGAMACGGGSSPQGDLGGLCYPNGTCNTGLVCADGFCTANGPPGLDAATDATGDALIDDSPPFQCADDSALEPNDTIQTAFQTPVESQQISVQFAGLAICPAGDRDHYALTVTTANRGIELIASWTSGDPPAAVSLLNAGGTTLANGAPMGTLATRVCVPNLPVGTYYAATFATTPTNYRLLLRTVASCP